MEGCGEKCSRNNPKRCAFQSPTAGRSLFQDRAESAVRAAGSLPMPQGGPGNCGGNLNGSGGSKRKMGGKQKHVTTKVWPAEAPRNGRLRGAARGAAAAAGAAGEPFQVHAPQAEHRAAVLRAHEHLAVRSSRPVEGTGPGGEVLGGAADSPEAANAREARMRYFQEREEERAAARASRRPATGERQRDGEEAALAATRRAVRELMSAGDGADRVAHLLELLAGRVGNKELQKARTLLCTVLSNAEAKGGDDPKYLLLKSSNDTLWRGLLQHPECVCVLELGGFAVVDAAATCQDAAMGEISELQAALQQQLEAAQPNHTVVETLMLRLEQLSVNVATPPTGSRSARCEHGQGADEWAKRKSNLCHLGAEAAQALHEVSQTVAQWEEPSKRAPLNVAHDDSHGHDSPSKELQ